MIKPLAGFFSVLLALTACGADDVIGVFIAIERDGSGTITTRSLMTTDVTGPVESHTEGVAWEDRVNLYCSSGKFDRVAEIRVDGIEVRGNPADLDAPRVRIVIPRGPNAGWVSRLAPAKGDRETAGRTFEPTKRASKVGSTVKFELLLPGDVVAAGAQPRWRRVKVDHEKRRAYLWIPVTTARTAGEPLVWDVSWK